MTRGPDAARLSEAFELTADPAAYVPRLALEAALAELTEGIGKTPACAALTGEAGLGKTLLLHVLRQRLGGAYECVYVPFPRLSIPELWRWAAIAVGLGSGEDDRGAVLGRARSLAAQGSGLVLLVDDAGALPASTRSDLVGACGTNGFSLVMAFDSEDHPQLSALPAEVKRVDLGAPMTLVETRAYVLGRLRRVDPAGEITAGLDPARLAGLHEASGGVPARLHALVESWLRTNAPGPAHALAARPAEARATGPASEELPPLPSLPPALARALLPLQHPRVRILLGVLLVLSIAGFWYFALQRTSAPASVGVPVPRFESGEPSQPARQ